MAINKTSFIKWANKAPISIVDFSCRKIDPFREIQTSEDIRD